VIWLVWFGAVNFFGSGFAPHQKNLVSFQQGSDPPIMNNGALTQINQFVDPGGHGVLLVSGDASAEIGGPVRPEIDGRTIREIQTGDSTGGISITVEHVCGLALDALDRSGHGEGLDTGNVGSSGNGHLGTTNRNQNYLIFGLLLVEWGFGVGLSVF
jgi:hypothetical protein